MKMAPTTPNKTVSPASTPATTIRTFLFFPVFDLMTTYSGLALLFNYFSCKVVTNAQLGWIDHDIYYNERRRLSQYG